MSNDWLEVGGLLGIILIFIIILFIPAIATIILGVYIANAIGLTGLVWWAFLILFWLLVGGILSFLAKE